MNIIATCGTSILTNAKYRLNLDLSKKSKEINEIILKDLVGKKLSEREYGAEINSILNFIEKKETNIENLYLIISDTKEGQLAGKLIEEILIDNKMADNIAEIIPIILLSPNTVIKIPVVVNAERII